MHRSSATLRICLALASVTVTVLLVAELTGVLPDSHATMVQGRAALCESVAVNCSLAAQRGDLSTIETNLQSIVARNEQVQSAALRGVDGELLVIVGDHQTHWQQAEVSTETQMQVPIEMDGAFWGNIEVSFVPTAGLAWFPLVGEMGRLVLFVGSLSYLGFLFYLRHVLQHLDPSNVIPSRVRATLDTLAEGLLVMDHQQRIVLANESFAEIVGKPAEQLQGLDASELPWLHADNDGAVRQFPWEPSLLEGRVATGEFLKLHSESTGQHVFKVNAAPILGESGNSRGALASFSDVTSLEIRNAQLNDTLAKLQSSRDQIRQQNEQLRILATRDPLTACLNRRSFFTESEVLLRDARQRNQPISYIIADIDHFKFVNDTHGHATGDEVLQQFAEVLQQAVRQRGPVCRYGGEEFCILLPDTTLADAAALAELIRAAVEKTSLVDLNVTASLGVAQFDLNSGNPRDAMELADRALYAAKRAGRNRVMRSDQLAGNIGLSEADARFEPQVGCSTHLPFSAVSALNAALYYRDPLTAEHSRRVADLCAATARGLMSEEQRYVLEVAALLHDIGKLGIPDAILNKPDQLSREEWKVMLTYEDVGVKLLQSAFSSNQLTEIVRTYKTPFQDQDDDKSSEECATSLSARILSLADAYDAMISDRVYRKGVDPSQAFAELRRCAGRQFDPVLVEHFVDVVSSPDAAGQATEVEVSQRTALRLGLQLERIASALDAQDQETLKVLVEQLEVETEDGGAEQVTECIARISAVLVQEDAEWLDVLDVTTELLDHCRMAQRASLTRGEQCLSER